MATGYAFNSKHKVSSPSSLQGLDPAPPSGAAAAFDFGNTVACDLVKKKFSIQNSSTFAVDVNIMRVSGKGLSPSQQTELLDRTAAGLPIISFRPEKVSIAQGETQEIEVVFRVIVVVLIPFVKSLRCRSDG